MVLQACWNALQHATFGNGDADSGGISLDHSGADEVLARVWNQFVHAYHGNPVLETEAVLCPGCGRAAEELFEPSCPMHIQGLRMVAPVLVTDGEFLPCGLLSLLPCAIRAAHLAGFDVHERYRLSKTAYCRDCLAWFGRDSVWKTYLSLWAHSWPSVTAYLLGTNVACDAWRVMPPTMRMQWRGLLHPSQAALPLLLDTIDCASDDLTLSTYHRVASLMGSIGTKCAICRTGLCDDEVQCTPMHKFAACTWWHQEQIKTARPVCLKPLGDGFCGNVRVGRQRFCFEHITVPPWACWAQQRDGSRCPRPVARCRIGFGLGQPKT